MTADPVSTAAVVFKAAKAAGAVTAGFGTYIVAQFAEPIPELATNLGLVALLAVLVGRYTFRQLEDYRKDLKATRERADRLADALDQAHRRELELESTVRALEDYTHRLNEFVLAQGLGDEVQMPKPPPR